MALSAAAPPPKHKQTKQLRESERSPLLVSFICDQLNRSAGSKLKRQHTKNGAFQLMLETRRRNNAAERLYLGRPRFTIHREVRGRKRANWRHAKQQRKCLLNESVGSIRIDEWTRLDRIEKRHSKETQSTSVEVQEGKLK